MPDAATSGLRDFARCYGSCVRPRGVNRDYVLHDGPYARLSLANFLEPLHDVTPGRFARWRNISAAGRGSSEKRGPGCRRMLAQCVEKGTRKIGLQGQDKLDAVVMRSALPRSHHRAQVQNTNHCPSRSGIDRSRKLRLIRLSF
jgi:hypothetical protein